MKKLYIATFLLICNIFIYAQVNRKLVSNNEATNSKNDLQDINVNDSMIKVNVAFKILQCKGDKDAKSVTIKYRIFDISKSNIQKNKKVDLPNQGDFEIAKLRIVSPDPLMMGNFASFLPTNSYSSSIVPINNNPPTQNDYYLLVEGFKEYSNHLQKSDIEYIFSKLFSEQKDIVYKFYDLKDTKIKWE